MRKILIILLICALILGCIGAVSANEITGPSSADEQGGENNGNQGEGDEDGQGGENNGDQGEGDEDEQGGENNGNQGEGDEDEQGGENNGEQWGPGRRG